MACVCLTIGTVFRVVAFFLAIGFLMALMTISFALQINLFNCLSSSEKVSFKDFVLKGTKLLV